MPSFLFRAGLACGLAARFASAYTQVNFASAFMYKTIDPLLFPGEYTSSHLHSFFGSDAVTASTAKSAELQKGCTNAENPNDLSVYWIPTLLYTTDDGATYEPVPVSRFSAYYNLGETPAEVAIPQDLMMLAGSSSATTAADSPADAKVEWFCEGDDASKADANGFPSSTCGTHLQTLLYFPQCVNVASLEVAYKSKDHGTTNSCPDGYSTMPQLRFSIRYDLRKALPDGWSGTAPIKLASGNAWSSHGDFINGWTTEAAENMIAATAEKQTHASVNGALGNDGDKPTCEATDAEPGKGASDYAASVAQSGKRSVGAWGWLSRSRLL